MKRIYYFIVILVAAGFIATSCNDDVTYAEQLKAEKTLIANYISRNNIHVLTEMPALNKWKKDDYVLTKSGLYFHLQNVGDTINKSDTLVLKNEVIVRYKQYGLAAGSDTISNWNTVHFTEPTTFTYGNTAEACEAFHEAVSYMKYIDSEAIIIVPSTIGFNENMMSVTPIGYHLRIRFLK